MSLMSLIPVVGGLLDKLIPDKEAAAKAKIELAALAQKGELAELEAITNLNVGQMEINKQEAASKHLFVAGWRPFIGWTCGAAICWVFLGQPIAEFILVANGHEVDLPNVHGEYLFELVLAMLGMGGLRTFEKIKGKSRER